MEAVESIDRVNNEEIIDRSVLGNLEGGNHFNGVSIVGLWKRDSPLERLLLYCSFLIFHPIKTTLVYTDFESHSKT